MKRNIIIITVKIQYKVTQCDYTIFIKEMTWGS